MNIRNLPHRADGNPVELGRPVRDLWSLLSDSVPLNNGSFGACPRDVQAVRSQLQQILEDNPDRFFDDYIFPSAEDTRLRRVMARLAPLVEAPPGQLTLVENTTTAVECVLRSMMLAADDRVLVTSHAYGAVKLAAAHFCGEAGAQLDVVPIPLVTEDEEIVAQIASAIRPQTRLVIVDHIASVTARIFPVERIVALCRGRGARILIDGAHAIGQLPLALSALGADWYVTNLHKWLFAPRGAALLFASVDAASITQPSVVSHYIDLGFPRSFDFIGTRDYTPWLAVPAAVDFYEALGGSRIAAHAQHILGYASASLSELGVPPLDASAATGAMRSFALPRQRAGREDDAVRLRNRLWDTHRIQIFCNSLDRQLILRISAAPYVGREDVDALVSVLRSEGWPGRTATA